MSSELNNAGNEKQGLCSSGVHFSEDGLVIPRKLPNPCQESAERKNVHRELLFNNKIGKNVLGQKSELQKAMEKVKDDQKKKEMDRLRINHCSPLEKQLEIQAVKLKQQEESSNKTSEASEFGLHQVLSKVRSKTTTVEPNS
ncbi:protein FAM107A-like [Limulus polyphemus]|uniref:Protein FAM107A-like n=1 Tax=Limulus polyphemus TaxID=6850 RepID=A0ABM1BEL7_LIMPO|nr:protein FAM107A-like [Limulus polyphemus]